MKRIILVRHAKSDWNSEAGSDFERPLNERGKKDAPAMASLISKMIERPDVFISSPANRAITTAKFFAEAFNYPLNGIIRNPLIYSDGAGAVLEIFKSLENHFNSVILFGHNPTISSIARILSAEPIGDVPTCSVVAIEFTEPSWKSIDKSTGILLFFEYPKKNK